MEAARTAASRGHEVVLFEKTDRLGGSLTMAAAAPFKADMKQYLDWAIRTTMATPNLTVKLSTEATRGNIKSENPDAIIIAAGAVPLVPPIPGIDRKNVVLAGEADLGKVKIGGKVVVAGAGLVGSEIALYLAQQGKKVTLIDMLSLEKIDTNNPFTDTRTLRQMLAGLNVDIITGVKLEAVTAAGAEIVDKNGVKKVMPSDTVVLALGMQPRTRVVSLFQDLSPDVYVIGDCQNQRGNLFSAIAEGFFAAIEI